MRAGKIGQRGMPLTTHDLGHTTGGKRGGLMSFVRVSDNKAFWVVPQHLERIMNIDE